MTMKTANVHNGGMVPAFPRTLTVDAHPALDAGAFVTRFPGPLGGLPAPRWLADLLVAGAPAPLASSEAIRAAIRDLLRHGGYKPTGRGKPASEYLIRAVEQGELGSINAAVDACNAVSLHSGLPISVVDLDRADAPFRVAIASPGAEYVFNAAGQTIKLDGLLCLHDAGGPCGNAVKDAQRTKTGPDTRSTLSVVWGTRELPGRTARTVEWYREVLEQLGSETFDVTIVQSEPS
jgi:DNA/RNA-binding domain of Phe-tRNA-synthetase-like protein